MISYYPQNNETRRYSQLENMMKGSRTFGKMFVEYFAVKADGLSLGANIELSDFCFSISVTILIFSIGISFCL